MTRTAPSKARILAAMDAARERTLALLALVPEELLRLRVHDFYSPVGWHFGHIAMTEEYWTVVRAMCRPVLNDRLTFLFANVTENPKEQRINLPARAEILEYMRATRFQSLAALEAADLCSTDPLLAGGYAWDFAYQHECQHQESITELLQLIQKSTNVLQVRATTGKLDRSGLPNPGNSDLEDDPIVEIPGGRFVMGSDDPCGYDNEKRAHEVDVPAFALDKYPVTASRYAAFMHDGGYRREELWSEAGWRWREANSVERPEYWLAAEDGFGYSGPHGARQIDPNEPASSLSWYEADAYARWTGKRLPTEEEWEFAAAFDAGAGTVTKFPWGNEAPSSDRASFGGKADGPEPVGSHPDGSSPMGLMDMAGGVWEWTSTPFLPYPGFEPFPYAGYSLEHMNGEHFVCRGGSWATAAPILRCSFRNWYIPTYRQGFLGLRCALR